MAFWLAALCEPLPAFLPLAAFLSRLDCDLAPFLETRREKERWSVRAYSKKYNKIRKETYPPPIFLSGWKSLIEYDGREKNVTIKENAVSKRTVKSLPSRTLTANCTSSAGMCSYTNTSNVPVYTVMPHLQYIFNNGYSNENKKILYMIVGVHVGIRCMRIGCGTNVRD